jgi:hypothetical protein
MRLTTNSCPRAVRARLRRSLRAIAVPIAPAAAGRERPHPQAAASARRCKHAATNELFTDIEISTESPLEVCIPRLRLCTVV